MATSQTDKFMVNDVRVCSICFEMFKKPRYLPCKHSFCHDCLSSYIVSQCKSTEPRLGFYCPVCRSYIPSRGYSFIRLIPINDVLQKLVAGPDEKYCEPCLRDNEKEESSDYCLSCNEYLCMVCAKCHRKNMAYRDHIILKINEMLSMPIVPEKRLSNCCPKHENEKIQMFCHDHEQPCCGLCVGTEHRKCDKVDTVEKVAHTLRETGKLDYMLCEVNAFRQNVLKVKIEEMNNISEIEDTVDKNVAKIEEETSAIVQHIENLKKKHIDEMFLTQKKVREKLQREIDKIEDVVFCVDNCKKEIEKAKGTEDNIEMIMKLFTAKEKFQKIKRNNFKRIQLKVSSEIEPSWMKISTEITKIANVKLSEIPRLFELDIKTVELIKFNEFAIENGTVYCGSFLSGGKFLFVNYSGDETCSVFDQNWDSIHVIGGLNKPYGAVQFEREIFVTNTVSKTIDVFLSVYFQKLRNFQLNCNFRGIICWGGNLYVACVTHILKLDQMGHTLQTYNVVGNNILHITTTRSGLIVYTDCRLETVTGIDDTGREVWIYKTCDLKQPMELDIDSNNNIYIAGYISNNIHALSSSGRRIRVIENIPSPTFCKINEDEGIMCVCSGHKNIKLYHLQPTM